MDELKAARAKLAHEVALSARANDGWPGEADDRVNEACRRVVDAMRTEHGEAWLGAVNLYGEDRGKKEKMMWKWDGSLVRNFSAGFVAPRYDEELVRLIMERDKGPYTTTANDAVKVGFIFQRLEEIGGVNLFWT